MFIMVNRVYRLLAKRKGYPPPTSNSSMRPGNTATTNNNMNNTVNSMDMK